MADIHLFPQTIAAKLRLQLTRCHNHKMLDRWAEDFRKQRHLLPDEEKFVLAAQGGLKHVQLKGMAA